MTIFSPCIALAVVAEAVNLEIKAEPEDAPQILGEALVDVVLAAPIRLCKVEIAAGKSNTPSFPAFPTTF